ncbi:MAG: hypothetical protein JST11_31040 [Acidobacteria bacterium]|nr:hypothetical protein [Acidobacteriota bacterium]
MSNLLEQFTAELNSHFFLGEFSFDKNQFRASSGQELELADHLIALPEAIFVFQIKERDPSAPTEDAAVEDWFHHKVLKKGCGQIADSINFLRDQPRLLVKNRRGHQHDLASLDRTIIPLLLYSSGTTLPASISPIRHHISRRAGFVHVLHIRDYYHLCQTLALPSELIAYFAFRLDVLLRMPTHQWEEASLVAQFISETHAPLTGAEVREILRESSNDVSSFDLSPILRRFGDKVTYLSGSGEGLDYYRILGEFSRLTRAEMRGFKKLLEWALDVAGGESVQTPARMESLNSGTGFVVIPIHKGAFENRLNALTNFAGAAKYDSHLDRQIGISVARDGTEVELDWVFIESRWQHDPEMEAALASDYPFRAKPKPRIEYRYPRSS